MTNHQKLSSCDIPLSWPGANNLTELLAQVICWQCRALQLAKQNERGATRRGRLVLLCWLRMLLSVWCLPQALNMFSPILFGKKKVRVIFFLLPPFLISLFFFFLITAIVSRRPWPSDCFLVPCFSGRSVAFSICTKGLCFWLVLMEREPEIEKCLF